MNKKAIFSLAAAVCVGVSAFAISACDNHKHTYDSELSSCGEAGHWYSANCGHEVDGKDFAEHNYGAWVTDKEANETADGLRKRTCEGCGYVDSEAIVHQHTYATELTPNGAAGHWYAATCSNDVDGKDFEEHNYGQLTKNDEGIYTRTCDDCGYVDIHIHNVSEWYSHSQKHYQLTDCGDAHGVEQVNYRDHEWKVEKQNATTTESGHYKEYCEVCGYILKENVIPPLGEGSSISPHTAGEGLNEGEVDENAEKDFNEYPYNCWIYTATAAGIVRLEVSDTTTALNISTESFEDAENFNYGEGNAIGVPDETNYCEINVTENTTLYILAYYVGGDYSGLGEYSFTLTFTAA